MLSVKGGGGGATGYIPNILFINEWCRILISFRLRDGLKVVLNISKLGNQYVQANKAWVLVKGNEEERYKHYRHWDFVMNV